jgi:hypothetical protein
MAKLSDVDRALLPYGPAPTLKRRGVANTSVIGLAPDQLAQYYPDDPTLVLRFKDLASVGREVAGEIETIRKALPDLKPLAGTPTDLLRRILQLPEDVVIDPVRPLAFVRAEGGWAAILPTRSKENSLSRLRQLDAVYCVAGEPPIVQSYRPGFRKGFYLPGDVSVIAAPEGLKGLGSALTQLLRRTGVDLTWLDGWIPACPADLERFDFAIRIQQGLLRMDLRAAPARESPTGAYLERMRPRPTGAVRWLPPRGTAYVELISAPLDWEALLAVLFRGKEAARPPEEERILFSVRRLLGALGRDVAAVLHLVPDGPGSLLLVGELEDKAATEAFLDSADLVALLGRVAGADGTLEWQPRAFEHAGVTVGMIQGNLSRSRLLGWRRSDSLLLSTVAVLMRGPVVAYVGIAGNRLCVAIGPKSRGEMELLIEHVQRGTPVENEHSTEATALFPQRLAAASADLGALLDSAVEAAPYWGEALAGLRTAALRSPIPVSTTVTVEGGAVRVALNLRPAQIADAVARLNAHLASGK